MLTREEERLPTIFPGSGEAKFYSVDLIPGGEHELFFGIVNLSKRFSNRRFDKTVNSNMLAIAGDDKYLSKQVDRTVGGLHGREFVFSMGDISARALFLNGGNRIYLVSYFAERETVSAETVNRIFDSFRPLRVRSNRNAQQLVGPERRERVAKGKRKRQREKDFAPPGQL